MAVQYFLPRLQDLCRQFLEITLDNQNIENFQIPLPEKEIQKLKHNFFKVGKLLYIAFIVSTEVLQVFKVFFMDKISW